MHLSTIVLAAAGATLTAAYGGALSRKSSIRIDAAVGTTPVAFVAVMAPGASGAADTVRGQTPASLRVPLQVRHVEIRSRDPRRAVWVRTTDVAASLVGLTGAAGVRIVLAAGDGPITLVAAEQAGVPSRP
jgi:hypothetical protein